MEAPEPTLEELEVLREFKRRMPRADLLGNVSPFDARIATIYEDPALTDLSDLNQLPRDIIRQTIQAVRDGSKPSQIVLLSGAAGTGKTHLLNGFRSTVWQNESGYVFVGGSNHWKMSEFQSRLLDWVIEALTAPSPTFKDETHTDATHPLLERIRDIGFRAVDHLLSNPAAWKSTLALRWGWLGRRLYALERLSKPSHEKLKRMAESRDPNVFAAFDYIKFGNYVCDRFLAERSNPLHRYAMRVMLTYLFPDTADAGLGARERVLNWFRQKADDGYFVRRLGTHDVPDRAYSQFEAVKLLTHIFSNDVSDQLSTKEHPCHPRVLMLTFDQAEGRNELFDHDSDWKDFFAQLSELYNTLRNVVVLFTMTTKLRDRLHGSLERQFRDRVRMDSVFELRFPTPEQLLGLYQRKMEDWLRDNPELKGRYERLANRYVPFRSENLELAVGNRPVRESFEILDRLFHEKIGDFTAGPLFDYKFFRNELWKDEESTPPFDFTTGHTANVNLLLKHAEDKLAALRNLAYRISPLTIGNADALKIEFTRPGTNTRVNMTLARVGYKYTRPVEELVASALYGVNKDMNFLFVVRPGGLPDHIVPDAYKQQMFLDDCSAAVEAACRGLCDVARRGLGGEYPAATQQQEYATLLAGELDKIYLGRLLRVAAEKLDARIGKTDDSSG